MAALLKLLGILVSQPYLKNITMKNGVAHLNLRDELLPFKSIIGEIVLFKNQPKIKTVVIKTDIIETKFRTFPMEVIAGEENFLTEVVCSHSLFSGTKCVRSRRTDADSALILRQCIGIRVFNSNTCDCSNCFSLDKLFVSFVFPTSLFKRVLSR